MQDCCKRAGVGTNGILECKFLSESAHRTFIVWPGQLLSLKLPAQSMNNPSMFLQFIQRRATELKVSGAIPTNQQAIHVPSVLSALRHNSWWQR
jgi:hypothetical protein